MRIETVLHHRLNFAGGSFVLSRSGRSFGWFVRPSKRFELQEPARVQSQRLAAGAEVCSAAVVEAGLGGGVFALFLMSTNCPIKIRAKG